MRRLSERRREQKRNAATECAGTAMALAEAGRPPPDTWSRPANRRDSAWRGRRPCQVEPWRTAFPAEPGRPDTGDRSGAAVHLVCRNRSRHFQRSYHPLAVRRITPWGSAEGTLHLGHTTNRRL